MNRAVMFLKSLYQIIRFQGTTECQKNRIFQSCEVLWIHVIDAICISRLLSYNVARGQKLVNATSEVVFFLEYHILTEIFSTSKNAAPVPVKILLLAQTRAVRILVMMLKTRVAGKQENAYALRINKNNVLTASNAQRS